MPKYPTSFFSPHNQQNSPVHWHEAVGLAYTEVRALVETSLPDYYSTLPINDARDQEDAKRKLLEKARKANRKESAAKYACVVSIFCALLAGTLTTRGSEQSTFTRLLLCHMFVSPIIIRWYKQIFGSVPWESAGTYLFLNKQEHESAVLSRKFDHAMTRSARAQMFGQFPLASGLSFSAYDGMIRTLYCVQEQSFDCIATTFLTMLKLVEKEVPARIEQISTKENSPLAHNFVVVNRTQGQPNDMSGWNADCIIVDPWYGMHTTAGEIQADPTFFSRYPLLNPRDKIVRTSIEGNNPPEAYRSYLEKLNILLAKQAKSTTEPWPIHLTAKIF